MLFFLVDVSLPFVILDGRSFVRGRGGGGVDLVLCCVVLICAVLFMIASDASRCLCCLCVRCLLAMYTRRRLTFPYPPTLACILFPPAALAYPTFSDKRDCSNNNLYYTRPKRDKQESMGKKCAAANVDAAVAGQLLASLDYARVRREGKPSTVLTVGEACVTLELGKDYFFDAREAMN